MYAASVDYLGVRPDPLAVSALVEPERGECESGEDERAQRDACTDEQ